jgi:hypothetical protein
MKDKISLLILSLTIISLTFSTSLKAASVKVNYPTKTQTDGQNNGTPWSEGSWKLISEIVIGQCDDLGYVETEMACFKQTSYDQYPYYQTTTDHYKEFHGSPWKKTTFDFIKCFGCR